MKRLTVIGASLVAALLISAVAAASASAAPPEYGRCVEVGKGHGTYKDSGCTKVGPARSAKYAWTPGPGAKPGFSWEKRPVYSEHYTQCLRALSEERVAQEDREQAANSSEPEKAAWESKAAEAQTRAHQEYELLESETHESPWEAAKCTKLEENEEAKAPAGFTTPAHGSGKNKVQRLHVICGDVEATGEYTGAKTLGTTIVFEECATKNAACESPGAHEGEIVTSALDGELGLVEIKKEKIVSGLSLEAVMPSVPFTEFSCGTKKVVVTGSVIQTLKGNRMESAEVQSYGGSKKAVQFPEKFLGQEPDILESSINGEAAEPTTLKVNAFQVNEEKEEIEVNDVV